MPFPFRTLGCRTNAAALPKGPADALAGAPKMPPPNGPGAEDGVPAAGVGAERLEKNPPGAGAAAALAAGGGAPRASIWPDGAAAWPLHRNHTQCLIQ